MSNSLMEIEKLIWDALEQLFKSDIEILQNDVNERTITHRLALYLQELFPDWHVDCEYNRHHDRVKKLEKLRNHQKSLDDTNAISVFPDIIIHRRMTDDNLLVIEVKKSTNLESNDFDLEKLRAFKEELGYKFALFIKIITGNKEVGIQEFIWVNVE